MNCAVLIVRFGVGGQGLPDTLLFLRLESRVTAVAELMTRQHIQSGHSAGNPVRNSVRHRSGNEKTLVAAAKDAHFVEYFIALVLKIVQGKVKSSLGRSFDRFLLQENRFITWEYRFHSKVDRFHQRIDRFYEWFY